MENPKWKSKTAEWLQITYKDDLRKTGGTDSEATVSCGLDFGKIKEFWETVLWTTVTKPDLIGKKGLAYSQKNIRISIEVGPW